MTLTRDTRHVTRGQVMAVPGAAHLSGVLTITSQPAVISLGTELLHYKCDLLVVSSREESNL